MSHFEKKLQINKIIESQLPEFLVAEFPKAVEFFKQYYISQESQGAPDDLICLLYTSPSPRDKRQSRMPSSA